MHDPIFLAQKSDVATMDDKQVAIDLLETLAAHKDSCVGMAANMIGVKKRIIAFDNNGEYIKRATNTAQKRDVYPSLMNHANVKDIKLLRFNIKMSSFNNESKHSSVGLLRLSNMKLIIVMVY